jgi:hypothetical protein
LGPPLAGDQRGRPCASLPLFHLGAVSVRSNATDPRKREHTRLRPTHGWRDKSFPTLAPIEGHRRFRLVFIFHSRTVYIFCQILVSSLSPLYSTQSINGQILYPVLIPPFTHFPLPAYHFCVSSWLSSRTRFIESRPGGGHSGCLCGVGSAEVEERVGVFCINTHTSAFIVTHMFQ